MKVLMVGAGIVGKATGLGLESKGNIVTFFDVDLRVRQALRMDGRKVVDSYVDKLNEFDIVMIAVPTPTVDGRLSHEEIRKASIQIGNALEGSIGYKVICIRSTVLPSTTRNIVIPALEANSGKKSGRDFGVCTNPEFLREATALEDFLLPDRIVIGELDDRSGRTLERLYEPFDKPVIRCGLEDAEFAKYAANGFLSTKISYFNEIARIGKRLGANTKIVSLVVSMDKRIGPYGTNGGRPYAGKCLPKDIDALLSKLADEGEVFEVLKAAASVNKKMTIREMLVE